MSGCAAELHGALATSSRAAVADPRSATGAGTAAGPNRPGASPLTGAQPRHPPPAGEIAPSPDAPSPQPPPPVRVLRSAPDVAPLAPVRRRPAPVESPVATRRQGPATPR